MIYNCDSHVGKVRKNNEDYCMGEIIQTEDDCIGIFALADGMGGHYYFRTDVCHIANVIRNPGIICHVL